MNHRVLLPVGLSLVTLGTAFVFVGVVSSGMFNVGIYLIEIGAADIAIAGILKMIRSAEPA